ncbi:MAG: bile acid-coenzyme ligase [Subtercola sp.]|nr:bile acid-coenzyme ligase [Subtercola sp.]
MARMTISRAISWLAAQHPDTIAVRGDDSALTWRELDLRTNRLARAYAELGVGVDSFVSIALPNSVEFVESSVAVWKLGATPQPLSYRLPPADRAAVLALAQPALVVGVDAAPNAVPVPVPMPVPQLAAGFAPRASLSDAPLPDAAAASWKAPTSSGSTGRPKLILAAASAHVDPEGRVASFVPARAVQLVSGPLFHSAPFTYAMRGLMTGHTLVILPRFDERRVLDAIGRHRITWAPLVPTMMNRLWRLPQAVKDAADLGSLESILHLGSACPPWLKRAFIDWIGPERVVEVYAGTESNGITTLSGGEWLEHPGSVGRPVGGSEMQIWGADDRPLPVGETGRIMMRRSGGATYSYRSGAVGTHPESQPRPQPQPYPDGWDTLGDLGHLDADGYLYVADRADDLIITGGVNVYPAEVEGVLEEHPAIRSAVVFGLPDDDLGEVVVALVDVGDASAGTAVVGGAAEDAGVVGGAVVGSAVVGGAVVDAGVVGGAAKDGAAVGGGVVGGGAKPLFGAETGGASAGLTAAGAAEPLTESALLAWLQPRLDPEKRPRRIEFTTEPVRDDAGKVRRHRLRAERGTPPSHS